MNMVYVARLILYYCWQVFRTTGDWVGRCFDRMAESEISFWGLGLSYFEPCFSSKWCDYNAAQWPLNAHGLVYFRRPPISRYILASSTLRQMVFEYPRFYTLLSNQKCIAVRLLSRKKAYTDAQQSITDTLFSLPCARVIRVARRLGHKH